MLTYIIKFTKIHNICPYIGMAVYMCVYVLLLLVTVTVFSHCGATEYYVRPTEPTNISCPAGQSCLTLNHYTSDSDHYFKSNTFCQARIESTDLFRLEIYTMYH